MAPAGSSEHSAVRLSRQLRVAGLAAPTDATITFARALAVVDRTARSTVYWTARSTLTNQPDDVAVFDEVFAAWWDDVVAITDELRRELPPPPAMGSSSSGSRRTGDDLVGLAGDATPGRGLRLSAYDADEREHAAALMQRLRDTGATRPAPRRKPARRGERPDMRATIRAAARTGGEPIERPRRHRVRRARRVVLLLDVSRSMEPYARSLLRFVHAAVAGRRHVEAFAMGTRLTHLTRELASRDPDRAIASATGRVSDWNGGTRLGACIRRFNDEWGVRGMARGSIVTVLSDGWERGDPSELGVEMARLHRVAHTVTWVNPAAGAPGFVPLARGLAAALPHVDHVVGGHSAEAFDRLVGIMDDVTIATTGGVVRARAPR